MLLIASAVFVLDQLSKHLISLNRECGESFPLIRNVLYLRLIHNTGAAFGIFPRQGLILTAISVLTIVLIIVFHRQIRKTGSLYRVSFGLLAGGTLGNLIDRLRFGYVVDFIDFRVWPVFNIADSAITASVVILLWQIIRRNNSMKK